MEEQRRETSDVMLDCLIHICVCACGVNDRLRSARGTIKGVILGTPGAGNGLDDAALRDMLHSIAEVCACIYQSIYLCMLLLQESTVLRPGAVDRFSPPSLRSGQRALPQHRPRIVPGTWVTHSLPTHRTVYVCRCGDMEHQSVVTFFCRR